MAKIIWDVSHNLSKNLAQNLSHGTKYRYWQVRWAPISSRWACFSFSWMDIFLSACWLLVREEGCYRPLTLKKKKDVSSLEFFPNALDGFLLHYWLCLSWHDNLLLVASFALAMTLGSNSDRPLNYSREIALESNHCEWIFITWSHHFMLFHLSFLPLTKVKHKEAFVIISFSSENLILLI